MKKGKTFQGQVGLARALGVTQQRVSELVGEGRIPRKATYDSSDVKAAQDMLALARAGNNATAGSDDDDPEAAIVQLKLNPERLARVKYLIEKTASVKQKRELDAGGYLRREDVEAQRLSRVYSIRAKLAELPLRASLIANKTEAECEAILREWAKEVCEYYAEGGQ